MTFISNVQEYQVFCFVFQVFCFVFVLWKTWNICVNQYDYLWLFEITSQSVYILMIWTYIFQYLFHKLLINEFDGFLEILRTFNSNMNIVSSGPRSFWFHILDNKLNNVEVITSFSHADTSLKELSTIWRMSPQTRLVLFANKESMKSLTMRNRGRSFHEDVHSWYKWIEFYIYTFSHHRYIPHLKNKINFMNRKHPLFWLWKFNRISSGVNQNYMMHLLSSGSLIGINSNG